MRPAPTSPPCSRRRAATQGKANIDGHRIRGKEGKGGRGANEGGSEGGREREGGRQRLQGLDLLPDFLQGLLDLGHVVVEGGLSLQSHEKYCKHLDISASESAAVVVAGADKPLILITKGSGGTAYEGDGTKGWTPIYNL